MKRKHKILIKYPSRSRRGRFLNGLDSILENIHDQENFQILVTADFDDTDMRDLPQYVTEHPNIRVQYGTSESKIHAVNRDMEFADDDWDIVVVTSDDIYFTFYGFDELIRSEMANNFPQGDGYLHFREKDSGEVLNIMTVCDKTYYNRFGYIYHPDYKSLWADNEQMEVAKMLGRYAYIPTTIIVHKNPAYTEYGMERDEMFNHQQEIGWTVDQQTYFNRKNKNFDL